MRLCNFCKYKKRGGNCKRFNRFRKSFVYFAHNWIIINWFNFIIFTPFSLLLASFCPFRDRKRRQETCDHLLRQAVCEPNDPNRQTAAKTPAAQATIGRSGCAYRRNRPLAQSYLRQRYAESRLLCGYLAKAPVLSRQDAGAASWVLSGSDNRRLQRKSARDRTVKQQA